jgi:outer membrane protein TolC
MFFPPEVGAQRQSTDSISLVANLDQIIEYALEHQPTVRQSEIDQEMTEKIIRGKLADWYPQINAAYNYNRFIDLQRTVIAGNVIRSVYSHPGPL